MNQSIRVLIVDDEAPIREVLGASLQDDGYTVQLASNGEQGLQMLESFKPHVAFVDVWMPGRIDGLGLIQEARRSNTKTDFIVMSGHGNIETAVKATKFGAWDFVEKPLSMDRVSILLTNLLNFQSERIEKSQLLTRLRRSIAIIGESRQTRELRGWISQVAPMKAPVLITGERGSGRELVAENIHFLSPHAGEAFMVFATEGTPEELIGMELFGVERGFLGSSIASRKGKIELCDGGTLYIDEVASLPIAVQKSLLGVIDEGRIQKVGADLKTATTTRLLFGTAVDLEAQVKEGKVLPEFLSAIHRHVQHVPRLSERPEDIPLLLQHFSEVFAREGGYRTKVFTEHALEKLRSYPWPGNVRELRNFVERVFILIAGTMVDIDELVLAGLAIDSSFDFEAFEEPSLRAARAHFEKEYILRKLEQTQGNITKTAELIGVERSHLHRKIKAYGIEING
ncbi:MAG: sigma-54 dependent transcriptional regulator [Bdellovibrionales bacterium]|nr:sigma-54 dependent transcriptional regulator [Bdellovibrionales bacterium]